MLKTFHSQYLIYRARYSFEDAFWHCPLDPFSFLYPQRKSSLKIREACGTITFNCDLPVCILILLD